MFSELNYIICLLFEKLCALFYIEYCYMFKFLFKFIVYNLTNNVIGQQNMKEKKF